MDYSKKLEDYKAVVEEALDRFMPTSDTEPSTIHEAMRYCVFSPGKRIRPIFAVLGAQLCGGKAEDVFGLACGLELIHTYSLIHDDLPSMDDDDFRRGKPSCHKQYGEAVAILTGDALLSLSYKLIADSITECRKVEVVKNVSDAIGSFGMVGGQVLDLKFQQSGEKIIEEEVLLDIIRNKTARLFSISLESGAMVATDDEDKIKRLSDFGLFFGFVFQLVDDIMDNEEYIATFGKEPFIKLINSYCEKAMECLSVFDGEDRSLLEWLLNKLTDKITLLK